MFIVIAIIFISIIVITNITIANSVCKWLISTMSILLQLYLQIISAYNVGENYTVATS